MACVGHVYGVVGVDESLDVDGFAFGIVVGVAVYADETGACHIRCFVVDGLFQMVAQGEIACEGLIEKRVDARVVNMSTIKPLDAETVLACARETRGIITVEDHSIYGGLGSAVAELVVENYPVKMKLIGVNDSFGMSGSCQDLYRHYGLTSERIVNEALGILDRD